MALSLVVLSGCEGVKTEEKSDVANSLAYALLPFQAKKNVDTVQENLETANNALNVANAQTCDAAAPFRAKAELAQATAAGYEQQAAAIGQQMETATEHQATAQGFATRISELKDEHRPGFQDAINSLGDHFNGSQLISTSPHETVVEKANDLYTILLEVNVDLLTISEDFSALVTTPGLTDWARPRPDGFLHLNPDGLDKSGKPPPDPEGDAVALSMETEALHNRMSTLNDDSQSFDDQMFNLLSTARDASHILNGISPLHTGFRWLESTQEAINYFFLQAAEDTAVLAELSFVQSGEATRNAWLAVEACGGELPTDLPPLNSPFEDVPDVPSPNSTFFDISSP